MLCKYTIRYCATAIVLFGSLGAKAQTWADTLAMQYDSLQAYVSKMQKTLLLQDQTLFKKFFYYY